jgi:hypothetical protein
VYSDLHLVVELRCEHEVEVALEIGKIFDLKQVVEDLEIFGNAQKVAFILADDVGDLSHFVAEIYFVDFEKSLYFFLFFEHVFFYGFFKNFTKILGFELFAQFQNTFPAFFERVFFFSRNFLLIDCFLILFDLIYEISELAEN